MFAACDDPAGRQAICDRLGPGTIEVFAQRWLHRLPMPFGHADQRAGYWWEPSIRQVEVSRTIVFVDAPPPRPGCNTRLHNLDELNVWAPSARRCSPQPASPTRASAP